MAEPSAAAPAGVADSGPDVLLATKLHVPRPRPGFVPRPRLAGALDEGLAQRLIRARLQQQRPGRVPALHRAAAAWCEEHGLADDAVRHALAAGDPAWAARLVERHVETLLGRSEGVTLRRWLAALPAGLAGSRPRLLLVQARLAFLSYRVEAAEVALDAAERALASAPGVADEPFEPSAGKAASLFANVPAAIALERALLAVLHGDAEQAITFGRRTLAEVGEGEWMLASHVGGYLGLAEWLRPACRDRARAVVEHRPVAGSWPAHRDRLGQLSPRPGAAGRRPAGRGAWHLPAGAGHHRAARPACPARRGHRVRRPGGGGLTAERD